jgi:hypothetical protein
MNQLKESNVKELLIGSMFVVVMVTSALAQDRNVPALPPSPQPQAQPQPPAPPSPLPGVDQPNVRFDITISEEGGGPTPVRKSVMLLVQGGGSGSLRSTAQAAPSRFGGPVALNVDIRVAPYFQAAAPGKIRGRVTVEYQPPAATGADSSAGAAFRAQVDAQFVDGKKFVLWQGADPVSARRTTVEATATLVK